MLRAPASIGASGGRSCNAAVRTGSAARRRSPAAWRRSTAPGPVIGSRPRCRRSTRGMEAEQRRGVGMQRAREELVHRRELDDLAGIHDRDAVGDLRHDAEIVGDEQHAPCRSRSCSSLEQRQHLRLDGDVERRRRLVGQQHAAAGRRAPWRSSRAGACRRRTGADSRACGLAADGIRTSRAAAAPRLRASARAGRDGSQRLGDLLADRHGRVERRHRLLEDHGDARCRGSRSSASSDSLTRSWPVEADARRRRCAPGAAAAGAASTAPSRSCRCPTRRPWPASRCVASAKRQPRTAACHAPPTRNSVVRSRTSRTMSSARSSASLAPQLGIDRVAQRVAEQVERQHRQQDGEAGEHREPPGRRGCSRSPRGSCRPRSASAAARRGR